jgi:hypothetical protein
MRQGVSPDAQAMQVARLAPGGDPFDAQTGVDAALAPVDNQAFRYFLEVKLNDAGASNDVLLTAFQITVKAT